MDGEAIQKDITGASGTPLIGTRYGYLPEIIRDGETGFLVDTVSQAAEAIDRLDTVDPAACRRNVEERFSSETMGKGYASVYRRLLAGRAAGG